MALISTYQNFYATSQVTNIGRIDEFEFFVSEDSLTLASNALAAINDTNVSEHNLKTVYSIYERTWLNNIDNFTPTDSVTLYSIALQSLADAGDGVYGARVLLNLIVDENGNASSNREFESADESLALPTLHVYPNPTSDVVKVEIPELERSATIRVISVTGQIVQAVTTEEGLTTYTLSLQGMAEGVYILQLITDDGIIESEKILLTK